jgi:DNA recombination protein RmuC
MNTTDLILVSLVPTLVLIVGFTLLYRFLRQSMGNSQSAQGESLYNQLQEIAKGNYELKLSNEQLKSDLSEKINEKLGQSQREMSESVKTQFQESQKLIKSITEELGNVRKTGEQVVGFTEQLKNLQDILQNSKQRGALGEYFLETTIKNILPPDNYGFQYSFKDGLIADAVIKLDGDKLLAIDSKFSLENYNNIVQANDDVTKEQYKKQFREDLKLRINETAKYIKPNEGTMDFAFMFIPSEGIYYDLLISEIGVVNSQNFLEYAFREKKVIVVSPSTLYAYLQTIMQGLRALQIEKQATTIIKKVGDLQKHISAYETYHEKIGNSLGTVINHYDASGKQLRMISRDTQKITGTGDVFEPPVLDKPQQHSADD